MPDLVELVEILARHRRIVEIGDAVPAILVHAVDDGAVVGDQVARRRVAWRCRPAGRMSMQLVSRRPIAMKRLLSRSSRPGVGQQHARLGEAARQHETFDDLEEAVLVVQVGLEVRRVDRHEALGAGRHGVHGGAHFFERADHADLVLLGCAPETAGKETPGAELRCEKLLKSSSPVVMDDDYSPDQRPESDCDLCPMKPRWHISISVPNASRFHRAFARNRQQNVCWFALYASHMRSGISTYRYAARGGCRRRRILDRPRHLRGEAQVLLRCKSLEPRAFGRRQR